MIRLLTITLLIILSPLNDTRLLCGVELIMSNSMELFIKLDCPDTLEKHQICCANHGVCYIFRYPVDECDQIYCECVKNITKKSRGICQAHGDNFCNIVKQTGKIVYPLFGK
ncbi:hypothetical protein DICVIV_00170 [Dictyocaulus viviparus]|uniref:Uncharacterized protein n=1 Tax=Dictyocaulus viviparus TaxID=29172 RepID=A0A0D8YGD4_DICVI|nr:hypothetical protein DICVIV_00170 [Dictyocaulus viviparus]